MNTRKEYYQILKDALQYYDQNQLDNKELFSKFAKRKFIKDEKGEFYDTEGNLVAKYNFEIIGMYFHDYKSWIWSWGIPYLKKQETKLSRRLLTYGLGIEDYYLLKVELTNARFNIDDPIQLDIHMGVASYLSKQAMMYHYSTSGKSGIKRSIYLVLYPIE